MSIILFSIHTCCMIVYPGLTQNKSIIELINELINYKNPVFEF